MNKFIFTIIFFIYSCSVVTNDGANDICSGQWMLIDSDGAKCNVCPLLEFTNEGKGYILKPSKEKIEFKYAIDSNRITFIFEKGITPFSKGSAFYFILYEDEGLAYLELKATEGNGKYLLARK